MMSDIKFEIEDNIAYIVDNIQEMENGCTIYRKTPVMTKELFIQCYEKWIASTSKHEDDCK